jgi:hypothetical protein
VKYDEDSLLEQINERAQLKEIKSADKCQIHFLANFLFINFRLTRQEISGTMITEAKLFSASASRSEISMSTHHHGRFCQQLQITLKWQGLRDEIPLRCPVTSNRQLLME